MSRRRYSIVESSKSFNGQFDCCTIKDRYCQGQLLFAHNESGKWEIMNYKNVNLLEYSSAINFIIQNF